MISDTLSMLLKKVEELEVWLNEAISAETEVDENDKHFVAAFGAADALNYLSNDLRKIGIRRSDEPRPPVV